MKLLSVIIPFFNEEHSVRPLYERLGVALEKTHIPFEIIFIDDGSRDNTWNEIHKLSNVVGIRLRRNFGQTQALAAGIKTAKGDVIVTLDGDLENDPEDIPLLLTKLQEGYDVVSGWRRDRWKKQFITRRIPSVFANRLISLVSGVRLHDHGCALKAYRREVVEKLKLSGEMHRMLAAYAIREGAQVAEVPVRFEPRRYGTSKYGFSRTFRVLLDIFALHFFYKYSRRPIHFFGGAGFLSFLVGFGAFCGMMYFKYWKGITFIQTPLPVVAALGVIVGVQFILMGLLAEMFVRMQSNTEDDTIEVVTSS